MPLPEARQVKRPRLALSCVVCRRRKVRCGKEQPECHNCVRLGETCVYNIGTRDPTTGRVLRVAEEEENSGPPQSNDVVISLPRNPESVRQDDQDMALRQQLPRDELPLPPDHEIVQRGSLSRLVGKSFWGFVNGQEKLNDAFFRDERDDPPDLPPPHISIVLITKAIFALPNKPVCEVLLHSYMVCVHPIYPVVDEMAFRSEWGEFWEMCGEGVLHTSRRLVQDPTFICLIFAILFAGASAAPDSTWETRALQNLYSGDTISRLRIACSETLSGCRHTGHPTLNTLSASILVHHFTQQKSLQKALSVSTIIRLAQCMGLQQENVPAGLDASQAHWRHLWWHIIWLDIQTSLTSGLPAHCGHDILLESAGTSNNSPDNVSVITLLATGQYEAAKIQGQIIRHLQGARVISQETIAKLTASTKQLHDLIDNLIAKIPMQESPEKGMFPSFANTSPESHPSLYQDQTSEPSVLGACARIMLSLIKLEVTIFLQKACLEPPDSITPQTSWDKVARLCLDYLQIYLHLRAPAFDTYTWFFSQHHAPRQCALLILLYLIHHRQSDAENDRAMVFCVNECMDIFASNQHPVFDLNGSRSDSELALNVLVRLREQLDEMSNTEGNNASASNQTTGNVVFAGDHDHFTDD